MQLVPIKNHNQPTSHPPQTLWEVIHRIQVTLNYNDFQMANMLQLLPTELERARQQKKDLSIKSAMSLSKQLNIGFEALITNQIDYKALVQHQAGNVCFIPKRYQCSALSRRRTVVNLLNYIEQKFGWEKKISLLRRFQMNESMFLAPNESINLCFSVDLAGEIFKYQKQESTLIEMGIHAANTHRHSPIGTSLSHARAVHEAFEMMFGGLLSEYVEKNFAWKLTKIHQYGCELEGRPNPDLKKDIPESYIQSQAGCLIRKGFIMSIPCYLNMPFATARKLSCVSQGDPSCRFEVLFPSVFN
jgi:hypothetical protein